MTETRSVRVRVSASMSDFNRAMASGASSAKAFVKELDSADSRMSNIVQSALAVAPALVPIGAAAVPAVAGLATQLTFTAGAAGTFALAFQGVGDAVKAVNDYSLEPTSENFAKLQEQMRNVGPAGREFVTFLQGLRPELQHLQNTASEGLFPGMQEGISDLLDLQPQVEGIVSEIAKASGDLISEAGDNLDDPRWRDFFDYLENEARPILVNTGRTFGNFVEGLANTWMAFDPLSDDFSDAMLNMSRDFRDWSDGLADSQGFQSFVDYVQESGPQVWDTLGSLADALIAVVEAAAPVGQAVLPVIETLADGLAAVARSDAGPILIGAAAGLSAVSRAVALYKVANGSAMMGLLSKSSYAGAARAARDLPAASAAFLDFGSALDKAGPKTRGFASTTDRLKASLGGAGKIGAGIGGIAFAMSDLDEKAGLTNTTMLGLAGSMAGPWGTAVGTAAGLALDFAASNDEVEGSLDDLQKMLALQPSAFGALQHAVTNSRYELDELRGSVEGWGRLSVAGQADAWEQLFGKGNVEEAQERLADLTEQFQRSREAVAAIAGRSGLGAIDPSNLQGLSQAAERLRPAFEHVGLNFDRFVTQMGKGGDAAKLARARYAGVADEIARYVRQSDTVQGRTREVGQAFAGLSDRLATTEEKASALSTALDDLLGPELDQDEALVAWRRSLTTLNDDLAKHSRSLRIGTKAGQDNRDALRGRVEALTASIKADAEAGVGATRLANKLQDGRKALLDQAEAAGFSRKRVREYLDTLGLTPKLVKTVIDAVGADDTKRDLADIKDRADRIPDHIDAKVDGDTGDAERDLGVVDKKLRDLDNTTAVPDVRLDDDTARRQVDDFVQHLASKLRGIKDEDVRISLASSAESILQTAQNMNIFGKAAGGPIIGPGTGTSDDVLMFSKGVGPWLGSNGEHVVTDAEVAAAGKGDRLRGHRIWEGIRHAALIGALPDPNDLPAYRGGGAVRPSVSGSGVDGSAAAIARLAASIADTFGDAFSKELNDALRFGGGTPLGFGGTLSAGQAIMGQRAVLGEVGSPYVWGASGPGGYDCSGLQSFALNSALGRYPYSRVGSTSTMPWGGMSAGPGLYTIGWFTGDPGHMSGNMAGLNIESSGDVGVHAGSSARSPLDPMFNGLAHYDTAPRLKPGLTLAYNGTGADEYVVKGFADGGKVDGPTWRERALAPIVNEYGRGSDVVSAIRDWLEGIKRKQFSEEKLADRLQRQGLSRGNIEDLLGPLTHAFGKNSEIAAAIRDWLHQVKSGEFTQKEFNATLDKLIDRAVTPALRQFRIGDDASRSDVRGEFKELSANLRESFGRNAPILKTVDRLDDRMLHVAKTHDRLARVNEKLTASMNELRSAQRQYAAGVAGNFRNDAFGGTLGDFSLQVRADTNDAQTMKHALNVARSHGLSGGLFAQLAASGNVELAQQFAHLSRREVTRYEHQFAQRQDISAGLGTMAGREVFGDRIHANSRALHRNERAINHNTRQMRHLGRSLERRVERGGNRARRRARSAA